MHTMLLDPATLELCRCPGASLHAVSAAAEAVHAHEAAGSPLLAWRLLQNSGEGKPPVKLLIVDTEEHEAAVIAQVKRRLRSTTVHRACRMRVHVHPSMAQPQHTCTRTRIHALMYSLLSDYMPLAPHHCSKLPACMNGSTVGWSCSPCQV